MFEKFEFSTKILIKEAQKNGLKAEEVFPGKVFSLEFDTKKVFFYRQMSEMSSSVSNAICRFKEITKKFLADSQIQVPDGHTLTRANSLAEITEYFEKLGGSVAMKPGSMSKGEDVYLNIDTPAELQEVWAKISKKYESVLIEKMIKGLEYRIFATREKAVAVTLRVPANVVGDGESTVQELIDKKNTGRGDSKENNSPLFKIEVDDDLERILRKQGKNLSDIIPKGEKINFRETSNLSTGGDSIDMTDEMPQVYKEIAVKAVSAIPGLAYAGVDIMIEDIHSNSDHNYAVIEVNSSPGFAMHHIPFEGKERNVALEIIKICFPEIS